MDPAKIAELEAATAAAKTAAEAAGGTDETLNKALTEAESALQQAKAPSQVDPVQQELDRVRGQGRTEAEKAAFSLKKNAESAVRLGLDPAEILGIKPGETVVDESTPMTVGMYQQIQKDSAQKTSLQLADVIPDENERELTKHYLQHRLVPSGDPQDDLRIARAAVNSLKNAQILEEEARRGSIRTHGSGTGAPPTVVRDGGELTAAEQPYLKAPWNMTKEAIIKARPKS